MTEKKERKVKCPNCGEKVVWNNESKWKPFCSDRCRLIDLGDWFEESNVIAGQNQIDEQTMDEFSSEHYKQH